MTILYPATCRLPWNIIEWLAVWWNIKCSLRPTLPSSLLTFTLAGRFWRKLSSYPPAVHRPTQLICIWTFICQQFICQQTNIKYIAGQSAWWPTWWLFDRAPFLSVLYGFDRRVLQKVQKMSTTLCSFWESWWWLYPLWTWPQREISRRQGVKDPDSCLHVHLQSTFV